MGAALRCFLHRQQCVLLPAVIRRKRLAASVLPARQTDACYLPLALRMAPTPNKLVEFLDGQPWAGSVDHPMTVRTD
jgi:hypothetical protein